MMGLELLPAMLATLPGALIYHLLVAVALFGAGAIVLLEWRHTRGADLRLLATAVSGAVGAHVLAGLAAALHLSGTGWIQRGVAPLIYAGELLAVLLLVWALSLRRLERHARNWLIGIIVGWTVLAAGGLAAWRSASASDPSLAIEATWQVPLWYALAAVILALGGVALQRSALGSGFVPAVGVLLLLGLGALLGVAGSSALHPLFPLAAGWARLCCLIGYPLVAVVLYGSVLTDLHAYREELQGLSSEALRQTQELLSLMEMTRFIGDGADLRSRLEDIATAVATALRADVTMLLLPHEREQRVFNVAALYHVLGRMPTLPRELHLDSYPALEFVVRSRKQLLLGRYDSLEPARSYFELIGVNPVSALLAQPLLHREHLVGLLIACNDGGRPFSPEDHGALAMTMGAQIAGAVENVRLYRALELKAQELTELLSVREAELQRESAILESIAEGILFVEARGDCLLVNRAAEVILGLDRQQLLGQELAAALRRLRIEGGFVPEFLAQLTEPLQTSFTLLERQVRIHAAPVLLPTGERLGVVAILQDVTREVLAEEAKRDFIASISHELRTPLTAIKGYTEVMLSGMAGELPPVFMQFLGVIRENTNRMSTLTNNIISVAEIERGGIRLNYQVVRVPEVLVDVIERYRDQLHERQLRLDVDLPQGLPDIEADVNRLRVVLDNLLSNAVKFTYTGGSITCGCRAIYGVLGRPMYFSIWVADTGVGIPVEEQLRIWERFYTVPNPLSPEGSGLGIGLSITKALVEAHGGRVWVDSTPGQGSTFTVLLPVERATPTYELPEG